MLRLAINRRPIRLSPPVFANELGLGTNYTVSYTAPYVESVFSVPIGTPIVSPTIARLGIPLIAGTAPYKVRLKSTFDNPTFITMTVRDSLGTAVASSVVISHLTYEWDELIIPSVGGTWTDSAVLELEFIGVASQSVRIPDIEISFWPYAQVP